LRHFHVNTSEIRPVLQRIGRQLDLQWRYVNFALIVFILWGWSETEPSRYGGYYLVCCISPWRQIDAECGAVSGMRIGRGNRSTRRKASLVHFVYHKSHDWPGLESGLQLWHGHVALPWICVQFQRREAAAQLVPCTTCHFVSSMQKMETLRYGSSDLYIYINICLYTLFFQYALSAISFRNSATFSQNVRVLTFHLTPGSNTD
jgi:hypothetical protein